MRAPACAGLFAVAALLASLPAVAGGRSSTDDAVPAAEAPAPAIDASTLDVGKIERARLARVDRMLAATRFGATYDNIITASTRNAPPEDADADRVEEHAVRRRLATLLPWRSVADLWRAAFAEVLSDEELDAVAAFHESDAGRTVGDCIRKAQDLFAMNACEDAGDAAQKAAYWEHKASPAGRAYDRASIRLVDPLMAFAMRRALERDAEATAALAGLCERKPGDKMCMALPATDAAH